MQSIDLDRPCSHSSDPERVAPSLGTIAAAVAALGLLISGNTGRADLARNADALRFEVVARTGSDGLIALSPHPSINENGYIAFVAMTENDSGEAAENIYVAVPGEGAPRPLMNSVLLYPKDGVDSMVAGTQTFHPELQINDSNDVLAWRWLNAEILFGGVTFLVAPLTYFETWNADLSNPPGLPAAAPAMGVPAGATALLWFFVNPVTGGVYPSPRRSTRAGPECRGLAGSVAWMWFGATCASRLSRGGSMRDAGRVGASYETGVGGAMGCAARSCLKPRCDSNAAASHRETAGIEWWRHWGSDQPAEGPVIRLPQRGSSGYRAPGVGGIGCGNEHATYICSSDGPGRSTGSSSGSLFSVRRSTTR